MQRTKGEAVNISRNVHKTPMAYRLLVQDGIWTEKVKQTVKNVNAQSGHVFRPTYPLRLFTPVELFVNTSGHLLGIPSAQRMVE